MIKVAEWGTGMMGQGLLGYILDRPKDIDLCGVIVTNPAKEGKSVGELLGRPCDVKMTTCLLYTSPSPRDRQKSRMPSSA